MTRKTQKTPVKGILIRGEMTEITDPAEQAELDRRWRAAEKAMAEVRTDARKRTAPKGK
jgi:hypothetical protein